MAEHVIEVKHITKRFKVFYDKGFDLKERVLFRERNRFEWRNVLEDISFYVDKGEAVGLIGHNGCGKSTTLKLLTRIMYPNKGTITIQGRVSSLIELGAGFHPDMTGRENIYINAAIFGLSRKEIDQRINEIIDFSELGGYIDNPVRTYSSGMYMRLAFSIAINVNADVLLVDEILAVGDANFQRKCLQHMYGLKAKGVTIVIVSHDTDMVSKFCDRAIWLNDGKIACMDKASIVAQRYVEYMAGLQYDQAKGNKITLDKKISEQQAEQEGREKEQQHKPGKAQAVTEENDATEQNIVPDKKGENPDTSKTEEKKQPMPETASKDAVHHGDFSVIIKNAGWLDENENNTTVLRAGKPASIMIEYEVVRDPGDNIICGIGINTKDKQCIYGVNTLLDGFALPQGGTKHRVLCCFDSIDLFSGQYELQVAVHGKDGRIYDFYGKYSDFNVVSDQHYKGIIQIRHHWEDETA